MRIKFSDNALNSMVTAVGNAKETSFTRQLYDKLNKAFMSRKLFGLWRGIELSQEELDIIKQQLGEGDGRVYQWGKAAREELKIIEVK